MVKFRILLTCAGGLVIPGIIEVLRAMPECEYIFAVDTSANAIGFHFADKSMTIPHGNDNEYIPVMKKLVADYRLNVILPFSDEEVVSLSKERNRFTRNGVRIVCSDYYSTKIAVDKGKMLCFLNELGIQVPKFCLPKTLEDITEFAHAIGYPDRRLVAKPRRSRGGRGFRILNNNIDVLTSRFAASMKLEWYCQSLDEDDLEKIVLMEYLEGDDFSVDCLARKGKAIAMVSRKRVKALGGPSQLGEVTLSNSELISMVQEIVKVFGFDSNINIQLKQSNSNNVPLIYEINPRLSGTIAASHAAGTDLLSGGIRTAWGLDPKTGKSLRPLRMIRYFKELYVKD